MEIRNNIDGNQKQYGWKFETLVNLRQMLKRQQIISEIINQIPF